MYRKSALALKNSFLKGEHTASEIALYFLQRIQKLDSELGSFLTVLKERVMTHAEALDLKKELMLSTFTGLIESCLIIALRKTETYSQLGNNNFGTLS